MAKKATPRQPRTTHRKGGGGYCDPPVHGQIKKGEVRNPWGPKGKPKATPVVDAFEFAASQPVTVIINGTPVEATAEMASHLKNMSAAAAGDPRAHKNVQDERRSRRRYEPAKSVDEIMKEGEELRLKEEASNYLINTMGQILDICMKLKKLKLIEHINGVPWLTNGVAIKLRELSLDQSCEKFNGDGAP